MIHAPAVIVIVVPTISRPTIAQTPERPADRVSYLGLIHTPAGLFAPLPQLSAGGKSGWRISARYSQLPRSERNNRTTAFGLTAEAAVAKIGTLSATAGQYRGECPDPECTNKVMLGAGVARSLITTRVARVGLAGEIGWSEQEFGTSYVGGRIVVPISLVLPTVHGLQVTPEIAPGIGVAGTPYRPVGAVTQGGGLLPVLGASLAVSSRSNTVAVQLNALRTFINKGATAIGVSVAVRLR